MKTFRFGQYAVKYRQEGHGPPMLLLHNGGSDHRIWDFQVPFFARHYTTYAFDLLGFGVSEKPAIPYTLMLYEGMIRSFLRHQRLYRPVLVGNCIGAAAALEHALRQPDNVQALVLFNVCGGRKMIRASTGLGFQALPGLERFYLRLFRMVNGTPILQKRVLGRLFGPSSPEENPVYRHLREVQHHPDHGRSRWNLMRGLGSYDKFSGPFDRPDDLPPTYLLWGAENRVLSLSCGMALASVLAPDKLTQLEGVGHMCMNEAPDRVNRLIQDFLVEAEERAA